MPRIASVHLVLAALLLSPASGFAQNQASEIQPMDQTPTLAVDVVARTVSAVNYRYRGGSTRIDFQGTSLAPSATGEAEIRSREGSVEIRAKFDRMGAANQFGLEYLTYVLWAISPEGRATNLGELMLDGNKSELRTSASLQAFALIVTAEPYFAVIHPSDLVVLENVVRADTRGGVADINARYETISRGAYAASVEPIQGAIYGFDSKAPLSLFQARNAVRISRAAKADKYASATLARAEQLLAQAEDYYRRQQGDTPVGTVSRDAIQTAEEARVISLMEQEKQRRAAEMKAMEDRADQARREAEQAKAEAEQARLAAEAASQKAAEERRQAEMAMAAARKEQDALKAETERMRQVAEQAQQARMEAEKEKEGMRAKLMGQLNQVLQTRDSARGLIVSMSDVLFDTGSDVLKSGARESLAKISGIILSYPDLNLQIEGHTDDVGSDESNQKLSERRAGSVRDYLVQQDVPMNNITARGYGETTPVAPNTTSEGRAQNRRVELIVSGEAIGSELAPQAEAAPGAANPMVRQQ